MSDRVLLVEDDAELVVLWRDFLGQNGFVVDVVGQGHEAVGRILETQPDLVVLDGAPVGVDGLEVCRRVRPGFKGGILMLTAASDEIDEVLGLSVGADDVLTKPVRPRVLLARLQALARRLRAAEVTELSLGRLQIDRRSRAVRLFDRVVELSAAEYDLLLVLAERAGQIVERDTLYELLRGGSWDGLDRSIDLRASRLRKKLGDDARSPRILKSVRGEGYLLVPEV